ncbi:DNA (cytosine-5-)-methyltransferase [Georgenia daeguensis]|uniref:Cytosine-specific methyltransferase n=1 Tax=Georgenia daeguensis TaxID=908355 RepID=A0ABP6UM85_9MICO
MSAFTFIDLFAGIGGFHAAFRELGGECLYAAEMDPDARAVYEEAWLNDAGETIRFARDINHDVPPIDDIATIGELAARVAQQGGTIKNIPEKFDVLAAGFPCQAFSKSGHQKGVLDETRGTLFYNILRIVVERRPKIVFLENVRNLIGPRHRDSTFKTIIETLTDLDYVVNNQPTLISPHKIHPDLGGGPQIRERVYILAIRRDVAANSEPFAGFVYPEWNPKRWKIAETRLKDDAPAAITEEWLSGLDDRGRAAELLKLRGTDLSAFSVEGAPWLEAWGAVLRAVVEEGLRDGQAPFPGHPIWFRVTEGAWMNEQLRDARAKKQAWKLDFVKKSLKFLEDHEDALDKSMAWTRIGNLGHNSWMKLEWQAGDARSLDECLIQLRPSGIRIKRDSYTPALVAINQTPILGAERRKLTPYEVGRLQGFPDKVYNAMQRARTVDGKRVPQAVNASYKQFGNAVHVGAVQYALVQFMNHHFADSDAAATGGLAELWQECAKTKAWASVAGVSKSPTPEYSQDELVVLPRRNELHDNFAVKPELANAFSR